MSFGPITTLTFFGDSLSDTGILSDLTSRNLIVTVPTPDSGYSKSFTNGEVYSQVALDLLIGSGDLGSGASLAIGGAEAVGATTFADFVNARVGAQVPPGEIYLPGADPADLATVIDLQGQVGRYLASAPAPGGAVAINIGLNDYSNFVPTSPQTAPAEGAALVQAVLQSIGDAAGAAVAAGASQVILYNLPSFRFFPFSTTVSEELLALGDLLLAAHNGGVATIAESLALFGVETIVVDANRISAEIGDDPDAFGFRPELMLQPALLGTGGNPTLVEQPDGSYLALFAPNPAVAGVDPDQLAFWDFVHPTAALHGVWGVFSAESLRSETIFEGADDDTIIGTAGRDLILAGAGNDAIAAGRGADVVLAGRGDDIAAGGRGNDILSGGSGKDALVGGKGCDVIADGAGCDVSFGGRGSDLLIDGAGFDLLFGGSGDDDFVYASPILRGGVVAGNGGVMRGGAGADTAYLVLDAETRASVEAELDPGAARQTLTSIGLTLRSIESVVILDPDFTLDQIDASARLAEADLWGLV